MEDYYEQLSLFEEEMIEKKITKPVRLISFFSGIEAQYKALSYLAEILQIPVESYKTCEWAYNSIIACNAIHNRDFTNYSEGKTKEEMIERIRGISVNYNEPLSDEQLNKKPLKWIQNAYNSCIANHNLINIMDVHASDLEIIDNSEHEYIVTYSYPCQDLSLAGKRAGMAVSQAEGGTRSGLLWEVERIITECRDLGYEHMPNILVMENVPQVHSEKDLPQFRKWLQKLEELGYTNYWKDLNSKNYGIPQNRERTFMVSILRSKDGTEYNYRFPVGFKRKYVLNDFIEPKVDERFYLSKKMINYLTGVNQKESKYDRGSVFERNLNPNKDIAATITTAAGQRATDNFILEPVEEDDQTQIDLKRGYSISVKNESAEPVDGVEVIGNYSKSNFSQTPIIGKNGIAPTFTENHGQVAAIAIREATIQGYKEAHVGDGVNISARMKHQRGNVQEGMSQTLKTTCEVGVVVQEGKEVRLRIRKITPKEAMRLMSFQDIDADRMYEIGLTDSAIFHCAGDSIVVCVLIGIFAKLFGLNNKEIETVINDYVERIKQC